MQVPLRSIHRDGNLKNLMDLNKNEYYKMINNNFHRYRLILAYRTNILNIKDSKTL